MRVLHHKRWKSTESGRRWEGITHRCVKDSSTNHQVPLMSYKETVAASKEWNDA